MTDKEILQEGIVDYIKRNKESYNKEVSSSEKAGGVAGAIGTGLGRLYKATRDKGVPAVGRGLQKVGNKLAGESKATSSTPPITHLNEPKITSQFTSRWGSKHTAAPAVTAGLLRARQMQDRWKSMKSK